MKYPSARRDDTVVDDYHGNKIADPYRWLEDPDAEETKAFVDAQNAITVPYLEQCSDREAIRNKLKDMWNYPKYSCPTKRGSHYFYNYNTGLQNQSVTYIQDSLDGEPRVFFDPNKLSADGTVAAVGRAFSEDGRFFAVKLSESGSDWNTVKFKNIDTDEELPDVLTHVKFSSLAWTHDHLGVFYNTYPPSDKADGTETTANLHQKLYYHYLGTDQSEDILCAEFPDNAQWMSGVEISDCGEYLIMKISDGCDPVNRLYYCHLKGLPDGIRGLLPFVKLVDNFDAEYDYIANQGTVFTFKTNLNAPRYKLINIDLTNADMADWTTLVDQHSADVLEWAACVNVNRLVLCYIHDVKNVLHVHDLTTGSHIATLPLDVGSISGYSGRHKDSEIFYEFTSFLTPSTFYRCDMTSDTFSPVMYRKVTVSGFDESLFETRQVFYPSKDGTLIPMFLVHKKDLPQDGSNPVWLYGYGGFSISFTPYFSVSRLTFVSNYGGVFALANLRGGGEYGEAWHKDGTLGKKQNGFDDFCAAAEYLIRERYTTPRLIAINGGSNGGLLVAACANQRPELFGVAISQVGVLDMLRFHKFTIGHAWKTDYGCSDKAEEFDWLIKYSPLHTIRLPAADADAQYPASLLLTADHDDRVVPLHSLKFIAELQHVYGNREQQTNPLMIRVDTKAGHGAGKPTAKQIDELTDVICFIVLNMGLQWRGGTPN